MAKWITCKKCSREYHSSLSRCPQCNAITPSFKNFAAVLVGLILCVVVIVGYVLGFTDKEISTPKQKDTTSKTNSVQVSNNTENQEDIPSTDNSSDNSGANSQQNVSSETQSATPSVSQESQVTETVSFPEIGTKIIGDYAYTTLPKYYLDYSYKIYKSFYPETSFEDYAYKLSDEQKANHTIEIIKNADGSATHKSPKNKLSERVKNSLIAVIEASAELEKQDWVNSIEHDKNLNIIVTLTTNEPDSIQKYNIVMLGLLNFENQLFSISDNKANVIIKFPNGSEETLKFPDDIK